MSTRNPCLTVIIEIGDVPDSPYFSCDRLNAAEAIGLTLNPVEVAMLKAMPESSLERMVAATKVQPRLKQAFLGYTASVMLAALTATAGGIAQDPSQPSQKTQSSDEPQFFIIAGLMVTADAADELKAQNYSKQSYMRISPQDENAPKGNLKVIIDNWSNRENAGGFFKIHLTKIESSASLGDKQTEGLGYARNGRFLQLLIPAGDYLVEIGFADKALVRSKKATVKKDESTTVHFKVKLVEQNSGPSTFDIE
jgi:hypothetical protein